MFLPINVATMNTGRRRRLTAPQRAERNENLAAIREDEMNAKEQYL